MIDRRRLLLAGATGAGALLSGCVDELPAGNGGDDGRTGPGVDEDAKGADRHEYATNRRRTNARPAAPPLEGWPQTAWRT